MEGRKPERVMHWTKVLAIETERIGHIHDIIKGRVLNLNPTDVLSCVILCWSFLFIVGYLAVSLAYSSASSTL